MAAPVFSQMGTQLSIAQSTTATVDAPDSPSAIANNDLVVVILYVENSSSLPTVTPPAGQGFAYAGSSPQNTTNGSPGNSNHVFWKRSTGSEPSSYTFNISSSSWRRAVAIRITGALTSGDPWDVASGAVRSSNGATSPPVAITTTGVDRLAIWVGTIFDLTSWTEPSGWTERHPVGSATSEYAFASREYPTAGATGNITGSTPASNWGTAWMGALEPATSIINITGAGNINHPPVFGTGTTVTPSAVTITSIAGIPSELAFGNSDVELNLRPNGISHSHPFGLANASGGILVSGINHPPVFGTTTVTPAAVTLTVPAGINHPPVFGTAVIIASVITPESLPYTSDFGVASVTADAVTLNPDSILRTTIFGLANVTQIASALTSEILVRPTPRVQYELVVAARIPSSSGEPTYIEVDPLSWTDIKYGQKLSAPDTCDVSVLVSTLTDTIKQRLKKPSEMATELWLYRNGKIVFAGPLVGGQVNGETLSLAANGLLTYLSWMVIPQDLVYKNVDQFDIVKGVVDSWQNGAYRHLGIDTTTMGQSGVTMDMTYLKNEVNSVYTKVTDLAKAAQGFDISVDSTTRKLQLHYPYQGVDRSIGPEAIVFDDRNVTDTNITFSLGPSDLATDAFGVGTGSGQNSDTYYSTALNDELRSRFGAVGISGTFRDVSNQAMNDSFTQAMIDARRETLWIPGPNVRVTPDADLVQYDVGDTVSYRLHNELEIGGAFRLLGRQIDVSQDGVETITASFV